MCAKNIILFVRSIFTKFLSTKKFDGKNEAHDFDNFFRQNAMLILQNQNKHCVLTWKKVLNSMVNKVYRKTRQISKTKTLQFGEKT